MIKKIWIIVMFCISIILLGGCSFKTEIPYPHSFETNILSGFTGGLKGAKGCKGVKGVKSLR